MDWRNFDRIMREAEWLNSKKRLPYEFMKTLKKNKCWRNNEPFCSWDYFTYSMSNKQIEEIQNSFLKMKEKA